MTPTTTNDIFLDEYSADAALLKYRGATAGYGVSYLLDHDYGTIYSKILTEHVRQISGREGARMLEFGCGAGMHLIHLVSMAQRMGLPLRDGFGTDFSERLIESARADAGKVLKKEWLDKVHFAVARTETISRDLAASMNLPESSLLGSFHLIVGVNTFRYLHRMDKQNEAARQLFNLLAPGGVCINIDMNAQFGMFRSQLKGERPRQDKEFYLPSLEEYTSPFAAAGFKILESRNFCWIPHSAGPVLTGFCRLLAPVLNVAVPQRAMRSLVIGKKPA